MSRDLSRGLCLKALVVVLILVLLVIMALTLSYRSPSSEIAYAVLALGGTKGRRRYRGGEQTKSPSRQISIDPSDSHRRISTIHMDHPGSGIGAALHKYSLSIGSPSVVGVHSLTGPTWQPETRSETQAVEGGARPLQRPALALNLSKPKRLSLTKSVPWREHDTWLSLSQDRDAYAQYFKERADILNNLELDWSEVMREIVPKLKDDREYIGLIDAKNGATGWKLSIVAIEASPVVKGTVGDGITYASVPAELVEKMAKKPAMFIFHTHPDDPKGSPLPSSADVSTAISMAYAGMFAGNVMISRYGAFLYAPSWQVYKDIHESTDPELAMRHYRHDAVAAMESIRSWKEWTLTDYQRLFDMHKLLFVVYPTSSYTAHSYLLKFRSYQDAPSDEDILAHLRHDIEEQRKISPKKRKKR